MLIVDVVIVVILVIALVAGVQRGLLASLGTIVGLILGGVAAFWLLPLVSAWLPSPVWRGAAVLGVGVGLLLLGATVGSVVGAALRKGVDRTPLKGFERFLGGVASVVVAALAIALVAPTIAIAGMPAVSTAIASSRILQGIDALIPPPIDATIAQLRASVMGDGLPRLRALLGPDAGVTASPPIAMDDPQLEKAAASVARISGVAYACGTGMTGSGFVVAKDRLITNAHVVAGVETPIVELPGRAAREGRIVYFDPVEDLAVISVDGLDAPPIDLSPVLRAGAAAAVEGYPNGGPFTAVPATVLSVGTVPVPDVYDQSAAPREIYALDAAVRPGNSGGPLLASDGRVAGLVFARGVDDESRGYAMTTSELAPVIAGAEDLRSAVAPGHCTR
ncbi:MarP family serine protease [Microbacterium deminutum]|uniref:MarP family serine protease n=1 Tax=Microbacterium deminutum TaxID=344164 RepID=A0ABN2QVE4_9MICO